MSYTLGGPDASSFDIGLTSGQITVGAGIELDYETKTTYMVTLIRPTDSFAATASIDVTIDRQPTSTKCPEIMRAPDANVWPPSSLPARITQNAVAENALLAGETRRQPGGGHGVGLTTTP